VERQNEMAHGVSKADACLRGGICRVRRDKHPFISLQFPHEDLDVMGLFPAKKKKKGTESYPMSDCVSRSASLKLEVAYKQENELYL